MIFMAGAAPGLWGRKLLDYTERGRDVADPWYSDRFDVAYRDIYEACVALLEQL